MILANVWKTRVNIGQFITHKNLAQIRFMSTDRKNTQQKTCNLNNEEGN